jgi:hypothetical protein
VSKPKVEIREYTIHGDKWWWGVRVDGKDSVHKFDTKREAEQYRDLLLKEVLTRGD